MIIFICKHCLESIPEVVTNVEVKAISQREVKVRWIPPVNVNSNPSLLQYKVSIKVADGHLPHMDTHTRTWTHTRVRVHTHTHACACTHTHTRARQHAHRPTHTTHKHIHVCMHAYMNLKITKNVNCTLYILKCSYYVSINRAYNKITVCK